MLYKYYSNENDYAYKNLLNKSICFTPFSSLNDPFEAIGRFLDKRSEEEKEWEKSLGINLSECIDKRISSDINKLCEEDYRVFCCTYDYKNAMMWANYANQNKGFCVGYNKDDIIRISYLASDIEYSEKKPIIDIQNQNSQDEMLKEIMFNKSLNWREEKEFRAIYKLEHNDLEEMDFPLEYKDDNYIYKYIRCGYELKVQRSQKYILKCCNPAVIYLGINTPIEDRRKIKSIADELSIICYQLIIDNGEYKFSSI